MPFSGLGSSFNLVSNRQSILEFFRSVSPPSDVVNDLGFREFHLDPAAFPIFYDPASGVPICTVIDLLEVV